MPGRSTRNSLILLKPETVLGTDSVPTAAADAVLLLGDFEFGPEYRTADRDVIAGYYRATEKLVWARIGKTSFSVEFAGSGTAGTAPQWGDILLGCGMAEVVTAGNRVEYNPISTGQKGVTIYAQKDGLLFKFIGNMGNPKVSVKVGEIPRLTFDMQGLVLSYSSTGNQVGTLTAWKAPLAAGPTNTAKLCIGGTYSAGAFTPGTLIDMQSFSVDLGNDIQIPALATAMIAGHYGRNPSFECVIDATAAQEAGYHDDTNAGTVRSFGMLHGTVAGGKCGLWLPAGRLDSVGSSKDGTILLTKLSGTATPVSGNDELIIFNA